MNLVQVQEHLKGMPTQVVMAYANGQNPQVPPYVALGELNRRKQLEQPQPQAPQGSVKEQIEQSLSQPQQLPGMAGPGVPVQQPPQPQGLPAQMPQRMAAAPQQQQPAQGMPVQGMAGGGLASVPVRKDMFNYAPGGIVAFANDENDQVVEEKKDEKLPSGGIKYDTERLLPTQHGKHAAGDEIMRGIASAASGATESVGDFLKRLVNPKAEIAARLGIPEPKSSAAPEVNIDSLMTPVSNTNLPTQPPVQPPKEPLPPNAKTPKQFADEVNKDPDYTPEQKKQFIERYNNGYKQFEQPGTVKTTTPSAPVVRPPAVNTGIAGPAQGNDVAAMLRAAMNAQEPTYKTRAQIMEEAAKKNPELASKPEEGLRGLLEKLTQSQQEARARAMQGEGRQSMADLSNALINAGEATRGQKGMGLGAAFGGFGRSYNAATSAANERQAQRDALQQQQDLTAAKLQYEIAEKARAHAEGNVDKEAQHDAKIAELKNKFNDDKRAAGVALLNDQRMREQNASMERYHNRMASVAEAGKPSAEDKLLGTIMSRINSDPRIAAIAGAIKSGTVTPGTPEFNSLIRQTEALAAPYYSAAGLTPPPAAQLAEEAVAPKKNSFWDRLFGGSPAPTTQAPPGYDPSKVRLKGQ